ncbi:MAG: LysM peptidoglycan-binding domain-containing protein, partial [Candidatus Promineofilum sp.]|nr:LysM peptidoglycan-binding domain-containing protein [Promineifilum sp.]
MKVRSKHLFIIVLAVVVAARAARLIAAQDAAPAVISLPVEPGDTWAALAARYSLDEAALRALNPHLNAAIQPAIGGVVNLPADATPRTGRL